jgi:hypothetical protein
LRGAIAAAGVAVAARWDQTMPVPPPVIWRRKREEAAELALVALSAKEDPLAGQRSFAEIPFGGDPRALDLGDDLRKNLPWDPRAQVVIPGTDIRIGGCIDRLDLAGDNSLARVTDYKSGKVPRGTPQLRGGAELQRCLYAFAVRSLAAGTPAVDARLLYPRKKGALLKLDAPEATLAKLTVFLSAAYTDISFGWGYATVSLSTKKIKGLHENDFIMASKIDQCSTGRAGPSAASSGTANPLPIKRGGLCHTSEVTISP